jgi:hypothetical protein
VKTRFVIAGLICLLLLGIALAILEHPQPGPADLRYWLRMAAGKDWSAEAAQGRADAECFVGLNLIRSNLVIMVDSVPRLSSLPLIGKRFFETTSYMIDNRIDQQQLTLAYGWINKAATKGYPPAIEAQKLFRGKPGL